MNQDSYKKISPRGLLCWGWVVLIYAATLGIGIDQMSIRNRELAEEKERGDRIESEVKRLAALNARLKISVYQWQEIMLETVRLETLQHQDFQGLAEQTIRKPFREVD